MDPRTAFVIAVVMTLLNGGVLGLVHRDLPKDLRPAAMSWRIGTLLVAAGSVLLAVQDFLPPLLILPLANAALLLGITGYWRAMRQFAGRADHASILLPALLGTIGVAVFVAWHNSLAWRVVLASAAWAWVLLASARELHRVPRDRVGASHGVLALLFVLMGAVMLARGVYYLFADDTGTLLDRGNVLNALTPVIVSILPVIGTTAFLLVLFDSVRRRWERAAATDYLTGLPNRRTIADAAEAAASAARARGENLSVAVLDVDHFKHVNDRWGHEVGDRALRHVARQIEAACRANDIAGRQGGEEFVVLFDRCDATTAVFLAEQLRHRIATHALAETEGALTFTVSIGVATLAPGDRGFDDVLRRADQAMYAAKTEGRNRVCLAPAP